MTTINLGVCGRINAVVLHADGSRTETGFFCNLITDLGLNKLGLSGGTNAFVALIQRVCVGTGNSVPTNSQVALDAQVAFTNGITSFVADNTGAPLYAARGVAEFTFAQGALVGTLAEIGFGSADNQLFSRALIKNALGNPITLSVTASDQLKVYYEITLRPPLTDFVGTMSVNGAALGYTMRAANVDAAVLSQLLFSGSYIFYPGTVQAFAANAALGTTAAQLSGTSLTGIAVDVASSTAYVPGSFSNSHSIKYSPTDANSGSGIGGLTISAAFSAWKFQCVFASPVMKTAVQTWTIPLTISWARA